MTLDIPGEGQTEERPVTLARLFFSFSGRIGPGKFWLGFLVSLVLFLLPGVMIARATAPWAMRQSPMGWFLSEIAVPALLIMFLYFFLAVAIKRCRSAGVTPWIVVPGFLFGPPGWLALVAYLGFASEKTPAANTSPTNEPLPVPVTELNRTS